MSASFRPIAIAGTGMVTSVGLDAPMACAAIRAGIANPVESGFMDSTGEALMSHRVPASIPGLGRAKVLSMAARALEQCLVPVPRAQWDSIAVLLCVAERTRPGRIEGLDDTLLEPLAQLLDARFAARSAVIPHGRSAFVVALARACKLIHETGVSAVAIVGADGLLDWPTLSAFEQAHRLLTSRNSNGFVPGEAAAAVLVQAPTGQPQLRVVGIGFGREAAHIDSELPLRGDGIVEAIRQALGDAACGMHDLDFRLTDLSGEQYYFKEASLAVARTLRQQKETFDLWHPAECIGETGSAIGPALLCVGEAACRKGYAPGERILFHTSNDDGARGAVIARYG